MDNILLRNGFVVKYSEPANNVSFYEKGNVTVIKNIDCNDVLFYTAIIKYSQDGAPLNYQMEIKSILELNVKLNELRAYNSEYYFIDNLLGNTIYSDLLHTITEIMHYNHVNSEQKNAQLAKAMCDSIDCVSTQYAKHVQDNNLELGTFSADVNLFYQLYYNPGT